MGSTRIVSIYCFNLSTAFQYLFQLKQKRNLLITIEGGLTAWTMRDYICHHYT